MVKISVVVSPDEVKPFLETAAQELSSQSNIPGFRPGKAEYEIVKQRFGEMAIHEKALENIIRKTYVQAVMTHQIETVGSPHISVEKLAPGNPVSYTAEVARMPKVLTVSDFAKIEVKPKEVKVEEKEIERALKDLQRMQTKETRAESGYAIENNSKAVLSLEIKNAGVPLDGGSSPNHAVYMSEDYYIPGFKEHLLGLKETEEKTFRLPFPAEHAQKHLAGKDLDFSVKIKEVYQLAHPEVDEAFAKALGQASVAELKAIIQKNLLAEKQQEENFRQEKELLETLAEKSKFEEIPDLLVNEEVNKMIQELEQRVGAQGVDFNDYLASIKKSLANLKIDLTPQALMRVKVALLLRTIAEKEKVVADAGKVDEELDRLAKEYKEKEMRDRIYSPEYRNYVEGIQRNRQVIAFLKEKMVR